MNTRFQHLIARAGSAALLTWLPLCAFANTAHIEPGHSALWIDPARNGEGWIVEILQDDTAVLFYYGSDEEGDPRWFVSHAPIVRGEDGDKIIFNELVSGYGGRFGPNYSADDVTLVTVGNAEMSFSDCENGSVSFNAHGITRNYSLTRLSRTMGAGCAPLHGTPGLPIQPYAGTSSTWFDSAKDGQAFTLHWQDDGAALMFWYSYDTQGNQLWMSGVGNYEDGRIVFEDVVSVHGGRFDEDYPPEQPVLVPWGRLEMELDCERGTATYESTVAGFGSGSFNVSRLTDLAKPACPWVKPKLTDLYDLEWTEVPNNQLELGGGTTFPQMEIQLAYSIANDGSIVGRKYQDSGMRLVRFSPGASEWETLPQPDPPVSALMPTLVSPDADKIYARREIFTVGMSLETSVEVWSEATGWQPLPNTLPSIRQGLIGQSSDGKWLTGWARETDSSEYFAWKWSAETGQLKLLTNEQMRVALPRVISNDGNRLAGETPQMAAILPGEGDIGTPPPPDEAMPVAIEWINGQAPDWVLTPGQAGPFPAPGQAGPFPTSKIFDCDASCRLLIGTGRASVEAVPPQGFTEAWYRTPEGAFAHIPMPVLEYPDVRRVSASINAVGGGATIASGYYAIREGYTVLELDGWLWTQDTGAVYFRTLPWGEYGLDEAWHSRFVEAISADGRSFLMWDGDPLGKQAILRLIPKTTQTAH